MTEFWIYSGVLVLVAGFFIVYPVYKHAPQTRNKEPGSTDERQRQNVSIFKERVAELEAEHLQGKLTDDTFSALKKELELSLLSDVSADSVTNNSSSTENPPETIPDRASDARAIILSTVLTLIVAGVTYTLYSQWGAYDDVLLAQNEPLNSPSHSIEKPGSGEGDVSALLDRLYTRLVQAPDNLEGWKLFSRTAMKLGQYDRAIEGFGVMVKLLEQEGQNSAVIYGLLAQAHYFKAEGQLTPKVKQAIEKALEKNPNEVNSLVLLASHAFDSGDFPYALRYWRRVLEIEPDHPAKASIENGIARAQQSMGAAPVADSQTQDVQNLVAGITVTVSLDPQLAAQAAPEDTVFIFAQAESGPRMPLAASRHQVSDLPVTVLLNDQSSMGPMAKLSQVKRANIIARISKSGQAIAKPGDLEGRQKSVDVFSDESVSIIIQNEL